MARSLGAAYTQKLVSFWCPEKEAETVLDNLQLFSVKTS